MSPSTASLPATPAPAASWARAPSIKTAWSKTGTLDRIATVDEVARVVEMFAGPLGAFVSGQVLRVDGGGQAWPA